MKRWTTLALATLMGGIAFAKTDTRPNIVVFLADDMGWGDMHGNGNEKVITPNLDKLASQGVRFTQAYSACGVCSPSRSAVLTGRTPYRNGVWRHLSGNGPAHLRASEITYPELLKKAGYQTVHVGKWHLLSKNQFNIAEFPQPDAHGYDYWFYTHNNAAPSHKNPENFVRNGKPVGKIEGYSAQIVANEGIHWLDTCRDASKPFVMSVWTHEPHKPVATDPRFKKLYKGDPNADYLGNITQMDFAVGQMMDALDERGLTENTLFIFSSDNGPEGSVSRKKGKPEGGSTGGLRGRKRNDYEGGIRVPMVVRWPGKIKPGTVSDVPVIGSDIFPTVLDACGVALPSDRTIDGVDMTPAFANKSLTRPIPMFWRTHVSGPEDRVAMRIGKWKVVVDETMTDFQLYDIENDRAESHDLAKEMPEKVEELKKKVRELWADIESEGPKDWWKNETQRPKKGSKLNY